MDKVKISVLSAAALLGLTVTASAGPMSVTNPQSLSPQQAEITPIAYYHHYRYYRHPYHHYGYYRHHYRHYGYYRHRYHRYYAWNPVGAAAGAAVGLATLPFALAGGWYPYYGYPYYY